MAGFEFTPENIVDLCPDLPEYHRNKLIESLERSWSESKDFWAEIEVPMREEPYAYILGIKVQPLDGQVTIERSIS